MGEQGVCGGAAVLSKLTSIHGMPNRWQRAQPYPSSKFLLPISHNLEQEECENAMEGDSSEEPTSVPHAEDVLLANQTESQPGGITSSPSKQHKLIGPGLAGSTSPDSVDDGL